MDTSSRARSGTSARSTSRRRWDCFTRYVWARLYTSKIPVTAVQILSNHVLPCFEKQGVKIRTILSDNGREYCGRPDKHPYELFLQLKTTTSADPTAATAWKDRRTTRSFKAGIPRERTRKPSTRKEVKKAA